MTTQNENQSPKKTPKIPCKGCTNPYVPKMLTEDGYCPRCESQRREVHRQHQRKDLPRGHIEAGKRKELLESAVEKDKASEEDRRYMVEKALEYGEALQNRIETYRKANPALTERYVEAIEKEDAEEQERIREKLDAQRELALRELSRRHLLPYVKYSMPGYLAGWIHKDICRRLEKFSQDVIDGKSPRLMLEMPPRHGKSLLATQKFPAWHLGHHPEHEFIVASYSASLANKFSKVTRAILRSEDHNNVFPDCRLDEDDAPVDGWSTTMGGAYFPTGVGGPATGRGAHILIIDDPVKNREEADSETVREAIKDWYTSTAYTRLAPGGGVLVIQTRWHDDDLAGWLEHLSDTEMGDKWEIVRYPAIATKDESHRKKGEALHPERYPIDSLKRIERAIGKRDWNALYQQNPVPDDGEFFKKDDLRFYEEGQQPPLEDLAIYAAADFAIGEKQQNDSTVIYIAGIDRDMRMWILDRFKGQWGTMNILKNLCLAHRTWAPELFGGEKGHIEMTLQPILNEYKYRPDYNAPGLFLRPLKPGRNDKVARARPFQGMVEAHQVYFPKDAPWITDALQEILRFPLGKHDDDVDALAWLGKMIELFSPVPMPKPEKKKSWKDKLDKFVKRDETRDHISPMSS